ncbi:MAG: hypothetical protein ACFFBP_05330 [Promethearchaeota archaeon]
MPVARNNIDSHVFEGKMKEFEQVLVDFSMESGRAKSADLKLQKILSYLGIHKKLTQKQFRDLTGYSIGTISKKLRFLIKSNVIEKKRIEKTNEYYYQIDTQVYARVGNLSYTELPKIKEYILSKLKELKKYENKSGFELLSTRLNEMLQSLDLITSIWSEMSVIFAR